MTDTARSKILEYLDKNPNARLSELAAVAGVSKQRVYQIVKGRKLAPSEVVQKYARPKPVVQIEGPPAIIGNTAAGTIAELLVAADLSARAWHVFFPLVRTTRCDLIALSWDGQKVRRIEVRVGRRTNGRVTFVKKDLSLSDHHAIVVSGEPVFYEPEIEPGR